MYSRVEVFKNHTLPIPEKMFGWILPAIFTPESFFIQNVGLDAVMFLRFLHMSFLLFAVLIAIIFPTLIPINYFAGHPESTEEDVVTDDAILKYGQLGLTYFSIANIPPGSSLLWAHAIMACVVSIITAAVLFISFREYSELASKYISDCSQFKEDLENNLLEPNFNEQLLMQSPSTPTMSQENLLPPWRRSEMTQLRTVFCQQIPAELASAPILRKWFENLGIGEISEVYVDGDNKLLARLMQKREKTLSKLEISYLKWDQ
ncbi:hypothetical protein HK096_011451, partial [Nowakowskiella sp. JEL0078]